MGNNEQCVEEMVDVHRWVHKVMMGSALERRGEEDEITDTMRRFHLQENKGMDKCRWETNLDFLEA